mmetsp:Transcript_40999/g.98857  ORF Transcript_40999/g.98857 Transcript_40999/m.98857 type:complete len:211 (-) Transcript_40999:1769-2401(-)
MSRSAFLYCIRAVFSSFSRVWYWICAVTALSLIFASEFSILAILFLGESADSCSGPDLKSLMSKSCSRKMEPKKDELSLGSCTLEFSFWRCWTSLRTYNNRLWCCKKPEISSNPMNSTTPRSTELSFCNFCSFPLTSLLLTTNLPMGGDPSCATDMPALEKRSRSRFDISSNAISYLDFGRLWFFSKYSALSRSSETFFSRLPILAREAS